MNLTLKVLNENCMDIFSVVIYWRNGFLFLDIEDSTLRHIIGEFNHDFVK